MKKFVAFVVFVFAVFMSAFTLGLGLGVGNHRLVDEVYSYTFGIWIPLAMLGAAVPILGYAAHAEEREKAEKFMRWCTSGLSFTEDAKVRNVFLDAIILALDTEVIDRQDVLDIFRNCSPSDQGRSLLRTELSERIQNRLQSGVWKLAEADANRRRLIEVFGYYKSPNYS